MKLFHNSMRCLISDTQKREFIRGHGVGTFAGRGRGRKSVMSDVEAYRKQREEERKRGSLPFSWNSLCFVLSVFFLSKLSVSEERMKQQNRTLISVWKWLLWDYWETAWRTVLLWCKVIECWQTCTVDMEVLLNSVGSERSLWLTGFLLVMTGNLFIYLFMSDVLDGLCGDDAHWFWSFVCLCCGFGRSVIS